MDQNSKYIDIGEEKLRTAFDPENYEQIIKSLKNKYNTTASYPPVAKLDIAVDSDSKGRGFESLRAGQNRQISTEVCRFLLFHF